MLLALWADFWPANYGPWPQVIPPAPPVASPTNAGSGQMRDYPQEEAWPDRAQDEFWDEREKFLMRHMPVVPAPYVADIPEVRKAVVAHNDARERVRIHQIEAVELPAIGRMMNELTALVEKFEQDAEDEAIEILLLM